MSTKRRIVVSGLDTPVRSIVNECLSSDHFDTAEFDENTSLASITRVDLAIFCAPKDLEQTQALCVTLRSHVSQSAPLLCCAGRHVKGNGRNLDGVHAGMREVMAELPLEPR